MKTMFRGALFVLAGILGLPLLIRLLALYAGFGFNCLTSEAMVVLMILGGFLGFIALAFVEFNE